MMTSWSETKQIENQILGTADPGEALLFDAQLLLDNELADKVITQQKAYEIVKQFGRKQLKKEIEAIQQALFTQPKYIGFSQKIRRLFKKT